MTTAPLSRDAQQLLAVLSRHVGRAAGIGAQALAGQLDMPERQLRDRISELREHGVAVCGHPTSGYYIAATAEDLERTCAFLRARAMHSLVLEARLRNIPLPDLLGQLHLRT